MKIRTKKLFSVLLCAILAFGTVLPAIAAEQPEAAPTWQNTIESVTPVGDTPFVKIKLTPGGYKIEECRLPQRYDIAFKDGTSAVAQITTEPSHFAPLVIYENYFDVDTPEGKITLYTGITISQTDAKKAYFSVGQYILEGSLGEDGVPAAGSTVYEFPIITETCEAEIDEGNFIVRTLYFLYSLWLKIQSWFVYHFGEK